MGNTLKEIKANGISYSFEYDEGVKVWCIMESDSLIDNCTIDLEIDLERLAGEVNWDEITGFLEYLTGEKKEINENLDDAHPVLKAFFNAIHKEYYSDEFLKDIIIEPSGIEYKGLYKKDGTTGVFEYSFIYYPYYAHYGEDLGAHSWEANFRGDQFLGVRRNLS